MQFDIQKARDEYTLLLLIDSFIKCNWCFNDTAEYLGLTTNGIRRMLKKCNTSYKDLKCQYAQN